MSKICYYTTLHIYSQSSKWNMWNICSNIWYGCWTSLLASTPHSQVEGSKKVSDSLKNGSKIKCSLEKRPWYTQELQFKILAKNIWFGCWTQFIASILHFQVKGSKKVSDSLKKRLKIKCSLESCMAEKQWCKNRNSELLARNSTFSGSKKVSDKLKICQR